jgi:SAM-dependent methyltransferase
MLMVPGFNPQDLAARYDVESFSEDEWHAYTGTRTAKIVEAYLASCQAVPRCLLNAGAGVYQLNISGWKETAVDLFEAPICRHENHVRASVEALPLPSDAFGAVVCVGEVLGYCNPSKALSEFARVLVPAGLLICDFGSTRSSRHWLKREHGRAADLIIDEYKGTPEPIWRYDPQYIISLLASFRFDLKDTIGTHAWSAVARRIGVSPRSATYIQRHLEWLPFPDAWADLTTIVAVRLGARAAPPGKSSLSFPCLR